jgi:hypothetical protein
MKRTLSSLWKLVKVWALDAWYLIRIWLKNDSDFPDSGTTATP